MFIFFDEFHFTEQDDKDKEDEVKAGEQIVESLFHLLSPPYKEEDNKSGDAECEHDLGEHHPFTDSDHKAACPEACEED